ncbi:MAG: YdiU family protein [Rhodospirillaceae bacterium]|nr:YdiU family protein [Rhodospirillaceae bacterium]
MDHPVFAFDNTYARLPEQFYARLPPTSVQSPKLIKMNEGLAKALELDAEFLATEQGVAVLAGNNVPAGADPLAMAYAGHQFGGWVPQLGDGRAILLGEIVDKDGKRRDVQLKGAGPTPFSRSGDGRSALGPVLREYIVSEAMYVLGVPTTRAFAAVSTGERVIRETVLPGAILTRVAASHIRVGTFQFFVARNEMDSVRILADYVIARHYPEVADDDCPYMALLEAIVSAHAQLVAKWQLVGFIHGVMNTDNTTVSGETIDYGPCAFMDTYHPDTVYSSIDRYRRYSYANQPSIAQWNLVQLAKCLIHVVEGDADVALSRAQKAVDSFLAQFEGHYSDGLARKLGLADPRPDDARLGKDLLDCMAENDADFTLTFHGLASASIENGDTSDVSALFANPDEFESWAGEWRARLKEETPDTQEIFQRLRAENPAVIPRNHLVEEVIRAAEGQGDYAPFEKLLAVVTSPFKTPEEGRYMRPPRPDQIVRQTFCGT